MSLWRTHESTVVYENRWIRVREDDVDRPDGSRGIYGVMEVRHAAVFVVPVTDDDEVVLVEVFRYTTGAASLEVPAGGSDGEDLLAAARRELREETGLEARQWQQVGSMFALNGVCHAPEHVFVARGLRPAAGSGRHQAEEGITAVRTVPWARAIDMVRDGTITDGETVAALMYAAIALGRVA
ncbi:NUDIX domain-containing protein [Cellulomonas aerilata]|uniref:ADP-ribose pyrophosphatase n=1 Tax=Cellulomonas aerilata TaxID=515326 RepID=A0A512D819_9CELL|nr:NUDIX hydrolase [Cellulomonas aerilata]GEO32557.1 ADP-ribose pyrophosphatase [Cellulomonas aerilata]